MPTDYAAIKAENLRRYGEDIDRLGPLILSERYADRTHFIYELLQNAEDALRRRGREWDGRRTVEFSLDAKGLTVSHFGKPFDAADVQSVCGIAVGNKELTDIGRFGIGFKSVYAFTDAPEIHSGDEHFAIDSYVHPRAIAKQNLSPEETRICIPFSEGDSSAKEDVLAGLQRLGPKTLLFLKEIEEVTWLVDGNLSGSYSCTRNPLPDGNGWKVRVFGQGNASDDGQLDWLVFCREVFSEGQAAGCVEVAFLVNESRQVRGVSNFPMFVFFPTVVPTNLRFLVQGPYRTTLNRDNVPEMDSWNRHLVRETALLLVDALKGLRTLGLLNAHSLRCLPLDVEAFPAGSRFEPLFIAVKDALLREELLPDDDGRYVAGQGAKLAGTRAIRELVNAEQLAALCPEDNSPVWLSSEITSNQTANTDLHQYLIKVLGVGEISPEVLVRSLTPEFLEAQSDEWIERLYEFLNGQKGSNIRQRLKATPLVRLEDDTHTVFDNKKVQAYLPSSNFTEFPTVKRIVCSKPKAREFLRSLGLRPATPVDDVIANLLPKYRKAVVDIPEKEYQSDAARILAAFNQAGNQRKNLMTALSDAKFIRAVDTGTGAAQFVPPAEPYPYIATSLLKELFAGVPSVLLADDALDSRLLQAVGLPDCLAAISIESALSLEEKRKLRPAGQAGDIAPRWEIETDYTLYGLDSLLQALGNLPAEQAVNRSGLLWQALQSVPEVKLLKGEYQWGDGERSYRGNFPADYVRVLRETAWVPDSEGVLRRPEEVAFADTGWKPGGAISNFIAFSPAKPVEAVADNRQVIVELAKEVGFELGALSLLKERGYTTEARVRDLLLKEAVADSDERQPAVPDAGRYTVPGEPAAPYPAVATESNRRPISLRESVANYIADDSLKARNQEQGFRVEELVSAILATEGFSVNRTGVGSDWSISYSGRTWLVEVKSTQGNEAVEMTLAQVRNALERGDDFLLCVVPEVTETAGALKPSYARDKMRFVSNISSRLRGIWDKLDEIESLREETEGDEFSIVFEYGTVTVRVASSVWEKGATLKEISSQLKARR